MKTKNIKMKTVLALATLLLITGCGNKELVKNYDNMKIGGDGIKGYILELRIYGIQDKVKINSIVRITNYNNEEYKIVKHVSTRSDNASGNNNPGNITSGNDSGSNEITTYIKNNKVYTADDKGTYAVTKEDISYKNPAIYLEGLNNLSSLDKGKETTVGETKYTLYKATFKKEIMSEIVADTVLKGMKIEKDVEGEVYIDSKGYVYRIIYNLGDVTINANYFSINNVKAISFPSEAQ